MVFLRGLTFDDTHRLTELTATMRGKLSINNQRITNGGTNLFT